jgi:hypothetical protein
MTPKKPTLAERLAEDKLEVRKENREIALRLRTVSAEAREVAERLATAQKELAFLRRLDPTKMDPPTWLTPTGPSPGHRAIPLLDISDIHWGEVVDPAQVQGVNAFDVPIAKRRVRRTFEGAITVARDYMKGVIYDGIQVVLGGDIVSGNIHDLRETNEETALESMFGSAEHLTAGLRLLADEFGRVHVVCVVGNHSRLTQKPIYKNRVRDSLDWGVYNLVRLHLAGDPRITVQIGDAASDRLQVYGVRYVINHGESFRGGAGIAAEMSPLLLGVHRMKKREQDVGHPFDILITHHRHRNLPMPGLGVMVNGSIVGYNEVAFDEIMGYQDPQQGFWLNTPERGVSMVAPIYVQDRAAEGW